VRIRLRFGDPIPRGEAQDDKAIVANARAEIEATLQRWRSANRAACESQTPP
jgi:hypothetical protein